MSPRIEKQQGTSVHVPSPLSFEPTLSAKRESSYPAPFVIDKARQKRLNRLRHRKQSITRKTFTFLFVLAFSDYALLDWLRSEEENRRISSERGTWCWMYVTFVSYAVPRFMYLRSFTSQLSDASRLFQRDLGHEHSLLKQVWWRQFGLTLATCWRLDAVSAPSASAWYPSWTSERDSVGGYEVLEEGLVNAIGERGLVISLGLSGTSILYTWYVFFLTQHLNLTIVGKYTSAISHNTWYHSIYTRVAVSIYRSIDPVSSSKC